MKIENWACAVLLVMLAAFGAQGREYKWFVDTFEGPDLDPRWTNDNSPSNINDPNLLDGGAIKIVGGAAQAYPCHQEAYNHLECQIDADLNFAVQVDSRINSGMNFGGNHLAVYWDPITYVCLHWGRSQYVGMFYSDPNGYVEVLGDAWSEGWETLKLRMEFRDDVIRCYAKRERLDPNLIYYPELDIPRNAALKAQNALLIIGKGHQSPDHTNPDFDNDAPDGVYGDDMLRMDNMIYEPLELYACGDPGTEYLGNDFNNDCDVNIEDLVEEVVGKWLWCSDPENPNCDQYWKTTDYFEDPFTAVAPLDPRWTIDTDQYNLDNGGAVPYNRYGTLAMDGDAGAWLHLETPIDGTGSFSVYYNGRADGANQWGPSVTVYYDTDNFVSLCGWWDNVFERRAMVDGTYTTATVPGGTYWDNATLKMVFDATTIKFYAKKGGVDESDVDYIPSFDMARPAGFTGPAMMIIGKGHEDGSTYLGPDMDSSYGRGAWQFVTFGGASYKPVDVNVCGDPGTVYYLPDLNEDCYVSLPDFSKFLGQWMWCTDPERTECDPYWGP